MKKIIIIGLIFILLGGVFCGAAYAAGEKYGDSQLGGTSDSYLTDDANKIYISNYAAEIEILKSDSGKIEVETENIAVNDFKCSVNNSTLEISYNPGTVNFGFISIPSFVLDSGFNSKNPVIRIYIPEEKIFDEIKFDGGLGSIDIEQLKSEAVIIKGGAGSYNIKNMITEKLDITVGMGSVKISGIINGDTKIEGGAGSFKLSGQANGNIKIKTGMGSATLDLAGNTGDYNIKVSKGMGSVSLNGGKMPDSVKNGGKYNLDISSGAGSININIK